MSDENNDSISRDSPIEGSLDIDKLSENTELTGFSEEERKKVYEEMEQLFTQAHSKRETLQYDISSAPAGIKLPLIFNIFLVVFVAIAILVTTTLLNIREKRSLSAVTDVQASNSALAQEIIEQNKADLFNKNQELNNIQAELDALLTGQKNISEVYAQRVKNYEAELQKDLNEQQLALRKKLEGQNISEEEIQKRLAEQKAQLESDYQTKLAQFKSQQEQEQKQKEAENQARIASLQAEKDRTQAAIQNLEEDIKQREAELIEQQNQANQELSEAQKSLNQLRELKEEKDKALNRFELAHRKIRNLALNGDFVGAMEATEDAESEIKNSKFSNETEVKSILTNFEVYKIILQPLQNLNTANQTNTELLTQIESLSEEINKLKSEESAEILTLRSQNDGLRSEINALQTELQRSQNEISNARLLVSAGESELEQVLGNIRLISNYLALRSTGVEDPETQQIIVSLTKDNPIYQSVIDILTVAINAKKQDEINSDFIQ